MRIAECFRRIATERLQESSVTAYEWKGANGELTLNIPAGHENGFPVAVECRDQKLYVSAGGWHGEAFEVDSFSATPEDVVTSCLGFLRTLLCADSHLTVYYAGEKPHKWVLNVRTDEGWSYEETGLLVYNFVGRRTIRRFQNTILPSRYGEAHLLLP